MSEDPSHFDSVSGRHRVWPARGSAGRIALLYALLGGAWILLSDAAVLLLSRDPVVIERMQNLKGILYVVVTTLLVYVLARRTVSSAREEALRAQLEETRRNMDAVLTHLGEVVFLSDPDTLVIRNCNATVQTVLGYRPGELIGHSAEQLHLDREHFHRFRDQSDPVLEEQAVFRTRFPLRHRDGRKVETEITCFQPDGITGKATGLICIVRDITETVRARRLLEESERKYRLLAENTLDVIWSMDLDGTVNYVNPAIRTLVGRDPKAVIGTNVREYCTPRSLEQMEELLAGQLEAESEEAGSVIVSEVLRADGAVVPTEVRCNLMFDSLGRATGLQGVTRDIRERTALEAQLRQAQKMEAIGTLASGIAHEVNNPVMVISGFAQLITHREDTLPKNRELAAKIEDEARRIQKIVDNLLGFARTSERDPPERFHLASVVDDALGLIRSSLRHDEILLEVDVADSGSPSIFGHAFQLQQVLLNLLTNARDALNLKYPYADPDKKIVLASRLLERDGRDWVRLTVEDHGTGIDPEAEKRLFDPFYTTKPHGQGTGLGLWISYGIVKEHHGRLSVETAPGESTRFHVDLPAAQPSASAALAEGNSDGSL